MKKTILAIPFYGSEELIEVFINYFANNPYEKNNFKNIFIISDKPEGNNKYLQTKCQENSFIFIKNKFNKGYLQSCNMAFEIAKNENCNLLLLNSDVSPYNGCFKEMIDVLSLDERISTVCPRTNNGTIANFYPHSIDIQDEIIKNKFINSFEETKNNIPRISFSPVSVGFCILIKSICIEEFGIFDSSYGDGYEEENDLCVRYSEYGYRSVIANHAFVFHINSFSFSKKIGLDTVNKLKSENFSRISKKYPYYPTKIYEYENSVSHRSYYNVTGSKWDETILIDIRSIGLVFHGTAELTVNYIKGLISIGLHLDILCSTDEYEFHNLKNLPNNKNIHIPNRYYKTGIRIGQPFEIETLISIPKFSYKSVLIFQDSIAYDCQYLSNEKLEIMWQLINSLFSHVVFISDYTKSIYNLRFGCPLNSLVCLSSTDIFDYRKLNVNNNFSNYKNYILVVGNKFKHKGINIIIPILEKLNHKVIIIGNENHIISKNIKIIKSGTIPNIDIEKLYQYSKAVLYPSFYEGFGLPVMKALAYKKIIICRKMKPYNEIYEKISKKLKSKLIFYEKNSQLSKIFEELNEKKINPKEFEEAEDFEEVKYMRNDWKNCAIKLNNFLQSKNFVNYNFIYDKNIQLKIIEKSIYKNIPDFNTINFFYYLSKIKNFFMFIYKKFKRILF
jgi:GT2 family glycosyltransferase